MTAMQQLVPALTNCFEQGLKLKPDFGGGFTLDFTLSPAADGGARAREGEVADSTLNSPLVEACILSAVRDADFTSVQVSGHLQVRLPLKAEGSRLGFGGTE